MCGVRTCITSTDKSLECKAGFDCTPFFLLLSFLLFFSIFFFLLEIWNPSVRRCCWIRINRTTSVHGKCIHTDCSVEHDIQRERWAPIRHTLFRRWLNVCSSNYENNDYNRHASWICVIRTKRTLRLYLVDLVVEGIMTKNIMNTLNVKNYSLNTLCVYGVRVCLDHPSIFHAVVSTILFYFSCISLLLFLLFSFSWLSLLLWLTCSVSQMPLWEFLRFYF